MSKIRPTLFGLLLTVMVGAFILGGVVWGEEEATILETPKVEDTTKAEGEDRPAGDEPTTQPPGDEPAPQPGGAARKGEEGSEVGEESESYYKYLECCIHFYGGFSWINSDSPYYH